MINPTFIDDLIKRLSNTIPAEFQTLKADWERNSRAILQSAFAKLDLVTREEFDAQAGVLAKSRQKLEVLEKQLAALEERHEIKNRP